MKTARAPSRGRSVSNSGVLYEGEGLGVLRRSETTAVRTSPGVFEKVPAMRVLKSHVRVSDGRPTQSTKSDRYRCPWNSTANLYDALGTQTAMTRRGSASQVGRLESCKSRVRIYSRSVKIHEKVLPCSMSWARPSKAFPVGISSLSKLRIPPKNVVIEKGYTYLGSLNKKGQAKSELAWVQSCVNSLNAVLAANGVIRFHRVNKGLPTASESAYCGLVGSIASRFWASGRSEVISLMKGISDESRRIVAMNDVAEARFTDCKSVPLKKLLIGEAFAGWWRSEARLLQLSAIGRSLPYGDKSKVKISIKKHYEAFTTSPKPISPELLMRIRDGAFRWAKRFMDPSPPVLEPADSVSACYERTRRKGGVRAELKSKLARAVDSTLGASIRRAFGGLSQTPGVPDPHVGTGEPDMHDISKLLATSSSECDGMFERRGMFMQIHFEDLEKLLEKHNGAPPCLVECVNELGYKVRTVTKSPVALVSAGHYLREWLRKGLDKDPRTKFTLQGKHREQVMAAMKGVLGPLHDLISLNSDLTAASDLIPFELSDAVVDGVLDAWPQDAKTEALFRALIGPMSIMYNCKELGLTKHEIKSKRGLLMGLPTTWALLSIIHLLWWEEAADRHCRKARRVRRYRARLKQTAALCGDDLHSLTSKGMSDAYEEVLDECSAKLSVGKHFVSDSQFVCFTENLGKVQQVYTTRKLPREILISDFLPDHLRPEREDSYELLPKRSTIAWFDYLPVKSLLKAPQDALGRGGETLPDFLKFGTSLSSLVESTGGSLYKAARRVLYQANPDLISKATQHGYEPHVPREYGGAGLPPLHGEHVVGNTPWRISSVIRHLADGTSHKDIPPTLPGAAITADDLEEDWSVHLQKVRRIWAAVPKQWDVQGSPPPAMFSIQPTGQWPTSFLGSSLVVYCGKLEGFLVGKAIDSMRRERWEPPQRRRHTDVVYGLPGLKTEVRPVEVETDGSSEPVQELLRSLLASEGTKARRNVDKKSLSLTAKAKSVKKAYDYLHATLPAGALPLRRDRLWSEVKESYRTTRKEYDVFLILGKELSDSMEVTNTATCLCEDPTTLREAASMRSMIRSRRLQSLSSRARVSLAESSVRNDGSTAQMVTGKLLRSFGGWKPMPYLYRLFYNQIVSNESRRRPAGPLPFPRLEQQYLFGSSCNTKDYVFHNECVARVSKRLLSKERFRSRRFPEEQMDQAC